MTHAILADDLTGACDAAAPFAARGLATEVHLRLPDRLPPDLDVVSVDVDTRRLSRRLAATRTATAASAMRAAGASTLYKKIDSTLRGHVAAELRACQRAWDAPLVVLCPAFPALGRWVQGGRLFVDRRGDVGSVAELAGFRRGSRIGELALKVVGRGADDVARALDNLRRTGAQIVVADANAPSHLAALADAAARLDPPPLLAGSAGLAAAIAAVVGGWGLVVGEERRTPTTNSRPPTPNPWLVVAGSQTEVTAAQIEVLARAGARVIVVEAGATRRVARTAGHHAAQALAEGITPIIRLHVEGGAGDLGARAEDRAARVLADACRAAVEREAPAGLFLTGGLTGRACLLALGAHGLRLESEPLPGIARGSARGGVWDGRPVITKAGGFGAPDAIRRLVMPTQIPSHSGRGLG